MQGLQQIAVGEANNEWRDLRACEAVTVRVKGHYFEAAQQKKEQKPLTFHQIRTKCNGFGLVA